MKNIIFEIDGEKHRLVEDNENDVCAKCSLNGIACESSCLCIISGCGKCHYEKIIDLKTE